MDKLLTQIQQSPKYKDPLEKIQTPMKQIFEPKEYMFVDTSKLLKIVDDDRESCGEESLRIESGIDNRF